MPKTAFKKDDRIAWDHVYATDHAAGSVVNTEAVKAKAPQAVFGTVVDVANEEGTYFEVKLDGEKETVVLTEDELVKVRDA